MKNLSKVLVIITSVLFLTACGTKKVDKKEPSSDADNKIIIGVSPVPHEEIIKNLEDDFKEKGLEVEIKVFDDYIQPNLALADGDLDANFFQHKPYLESFSKDRNLDLTAIGNVHIEPMGLYSTKIDTIEELKEGSLILIPNDPSNGRRALLLLETNGLIELKDSNNPNLTEKDILKNPKKLEFKSVDAANIANLYQDADAAIINTNYALGAGIKPNTDSLILEDKDSPYANCIVVRTEDKDKEKFKTLIEIIQSEKTSAFIKEKYKGEIYPAF